MKYFFNILGLLLLAQSSYASKINLTYESNNFENALIVKSIFMKKYSIPSELVLINRGQCDQTNQDVRFLNLCINKKGDLIKISQDIKFKINSLLTFR